MKFFLTFATSNNILMLQVKEICSQKGITLQALAKKMGVTYQSLYENLTGNPSLKKLTEIADALGVEVSELFAPRRNTFTCPNCGAEISVTLQSGK